MSNSTNPYKLPSLNSLQVYESNPLAKEGNALNSVPSNLQKLLPNFKLLQPQLKPGVYGIYFPTINQIYWGQSIKTSFELSMYSTGQRSQIYINKLIRENGLNTFYFSLFQGPLLANNTLRKAIETKLINSTSNYNVNILQKVEPEEVSSKDTSELINLKTTIIKGTLSLYKLKYIAEEFQPGKPCIYIFINPATLGFYIGETRDFFGAKVIKRHRATINGANNRIIKGETIKVDQKYNQIIADLKQSNNELVFACLRNLDSNDKKERVDVETSFKLECKRLYGNRMYNLVNNLSPASNLVQSDTTKKRISESMLNTPVTIDTTAYPCVVEGIWFNSLADACRYKGVNPKGGLRARFKSANHPDYIWLKDPCGKKLPPNPEIQAKAKDFFANLKIKKKVVIQR
jgi:hypothetical protein